MTNTDTSIGDTEIILSNIWRDQLKTVAVLLATSAFLSFGRNHPYPLLEVQISQIYSS